MWAVVLAVVLVAFGLAIVAAAHESRPKRLNRYMPHPRPWLAECGNPDCGCHSW